MSTGHTVRAGFGWSQIFGIAALVLLLGGGAVVRAQTTLPVYHPAQRLSGTIHIWGHGNLHDDYIGPLLRAWEEAFRRQQPDVQFTNGMLGNASAIGGLYTGVADVALMDRMAWPIEQDGFQQVFNYDPVGFTIMTGSLNVAHHTPALVMLVNKSNPLTTMTLAQLDSLYDADRLRGGTPIHAWGDLGLKSAWAARPVHIYGYPIASKQAQFFERAVMGKADDKWNCSLRLRKTEAEVIDAVAHDPEGVGFATLERPDPRTKPLALVPLAGESAVTASRETVAARTYPLAQPIWIYTVHLPGTPQDPKVAEFLRFILSREGQTIITNDGGYFPLPPLLAHSEMEKVK